MRRSSLVGGGVAKRRGRRAVRRDGEDVATFMAIDSRRDLAW